jgi:hypothetical protein
LSVATSVRPPPYYRPPPSGLSSVSSKTAVAKCDGGLPSSADMLVWRKIYQRLRVADQLAECMGTRATEFVQTPAAIIRFHLLTIAPVTRRPRNDPTFKAARDLSPEESRTGFIVNYLTC